MKHPFVLSVIISMALTFGASAHGSNHAGHKPVSIQHFPAEHLPAYDAQVIDQGGRSQRFVEDVLGDGKILATFVYTRCDTICPVSSAVMQLVERELEKRGDTSTKLVSISIDPENDGPVELAELAKNFDAGKRWTLLSGSPAEIRPLLRSLGVRADVLVQHDPMFLVGSGSRQTYARIIGLPEPDDLLNALDQVNP